MTWGRFDCNPSRDLQSSARNEFRNTLIFDDIHATASPLSCCKLVPFVNYSMTKAFCVYMLYISEFETRFGERIIVVGRYINSELYVYFEFLMYF